MRHHIHRITLATVGSMLAVSLPAAATAAGNDGPPTNSQDLLTLKVLGKLIPLGLPIPQLPLAPFVFDESEWAVPSAPVADDPLYGGRAVGLYAEAGVTDVLEVQTGTLGTSYVAPNGGWSEESMVDLQPEVWPLLSHVQALSSKTMSYSNTIEHAMATATSQIGHLSFSTAELVVDGLVATTRAERLPDGDVATTANLRFDGLKILGVQLNEKDTVPNTTYQVPGLGTVVINEQIFTRLPGDRYAAKMHALHVTLSTAQFGLPAGADVYIGTAESIIYE